MANLREILSKNIRNMRKTLGLTQSQLAIDADISLSYLTDIERCKTWVSDKTLQSLSKALHTDVFHLFNPHEITARDGSSKSNITIDYIEKLINRQKAQLSQTITTSMDELFKQING
jgi:transcriptional regulator with XRE-family HTH domain